MHRIFVAGSQLEADQVRAFLEASGIPVLERGEAIRTTHGLRMGKAAAVELFVQDADAERARELLDSAESGALRLTDDDAGA